jgi:hypothetical protein
MAFRVAADIPPGTSVSAFDIGALSFFGNVEVVDLGGLVERSFLPFLHEGRVPDFLRQRGIRYVVLPMEAASRSWLGTRLGLLGKGAPPLVPVESEWTRDPSGYKLAYEATFLASPGQVLFRILD